MTTAQAIPCKRCIYYYITWDPSAPNGCKFHGFKSKLLPSVVVYQSSMMNCQAFTQKNSPK